MNGNLNLEKHKKIAENNRRGKKSKDTHDLKCLKLQAKMWIRERICRQTNVGAS